MLSGVWVFEYHQPSGGVPMCVWRGLLRLTCDLLALGRYATPMNVNPARYHRSEVAGEVDMAAIRQLLAAHAEQGHSLTDTIFLPLITNIAFLHSIGHNLNDLNIDLAPTHPPLPHNK
jgi:hypothetical protein